MKWDIKHDRAKKVLNHFLDNAGYWTETESLTEGLTEEEIQEVSAEVATMIQSITKRYKLDVMLPAEPVVKEELAAEEKVEEPVTEEPAEEVKEEKPAEKPKRRGRKPKKEEVAYDGIREKDNRHLGAAVKLRVRLGVHLDRIHKERGKGETERIQREPAAVPGTTG